MGRSIIYKKIAGSIFGGAVGDAMGGPLETKDDAFIQARYGGRVVTLQPYDTARMGAANLGAEAGTYTDDTRLKNLLCQAIIEKKGRISAEDLADVWRREMNPALFFVTEQIAYAKIMSREMLARFPYAKEINPTLTARAFGEGALPACDANMMISPIGIINAFDPFQAALDACEVALLFQSGYAVWSCAPIAAAVAEAMRPDATWESALQSALQYTDRFTAKYLQEVLHTVDDCGGPAEFKARFYERHLVHFVDPMEVVPAVFGILKVCRGDFRSCVIEAANFGRDCDTIAGIVGSIAGALHGIDAVPEEWIARIKTANPAPDLDQQIAGLHEALCQEARNARTRLDALAQWL